MIRLYETGSNRLCGTLSDRQFEILAEALEEEDLEDGESSLSIETIERLEDEGAEPNLLDILRAALGDQTEVAIRCERS
jgi:processive 1,2-diacylglycerol beta-glucosyltransferase